MFGGRVWYDLYSISTSSVPNALIGEDLEIRPYNGNCCGFDHCGVVMWHLCNCNELVIKRCCSFLSQ